MGFGAEQESQMFCSRLWLGILVSGCASGISSNGAYGRALVVKADGPDTELWLQMRTSNRLLLLRLFPPADQAGKNEEK